jgi:magnesium transporter
MKSNKLQSKKIGLPPGTLVHIGKHKTAKVKVSIIDYDENNFTETVCKNIDECINAKKTGTVSWINIDGLHDTETIASIGKQFDLHPLLLEDILNTGHRPKVEEFDNCLFLTLKMLGLSNDGNSITFEQISFVLGKGWIISFQEQEGDIFDILRHRIRENMGTLRKVGADYLLYRLIDTVVDHYFIVTDHIGEVIEELEEKVLHTPDKDSLQEIQQIKKQLSNIRKAVIPLREVVTFLEKDSTALIEDKTIRYLRDVYEHTIQINDSAESQRDALASLMDLYLSGISNRTNQVMKVLTIIATIFIPLTFIVGIYGMNFDFMPELHWKYGYFGIWGIMVAVCVMLVMFFKRKRWL